MRSAEPGATDARSVRSGHPEAARGGRETGLKNDYGAVWDASSLAECAMEAAQHALGAPVAGRARLAAWLRGVELELRPGDFRHGLLDAAEQDAADRAAGRR